MEDRCKHLRNFQIEILEKFYTALDQIPLPVLQKFPQFNTRTFQDLKILYQHVKAKIRLVETKLTHIEYDKNQKHVQELSEITSRCINDSPLSKTSQSSNQQLIIGISDSDSFNASNTNCSDVGSSFTNIMKVKTTVSPTIEDFSQSLQKNNESYIKKKEDIDSHISLQDQSNDSLVQTKKSIFQLKKPIKASVTSEISKQIGEIWKKEEQSKVANTKTIISNFNISSDKLEKIESNEKNIYFEEKKKTVQISQKLKCENNQSNLNIKDASYINGKFILLLYYIYIYYTYIQLFICIDNTSYSYSQDIVDCLTQELEQFPALSTDCNIKSSFKGKDKLL